MEKLYNVYTDSDKIILINKNVKGKAKVLVENKFEFDNETEKQNLIFCYSPDYEILNNGYRHLYDVKIHDDLSNIKTFYDKDGILSEFGIISDLNKEYIPVYIRYDLLKIKQDMQELIKAISDFFIKNINLNYNKENIYTMGLLFFYDSEAIDINLTIGTESERSNLEKGGYDTEYLGNYSLRVNLNGAIKDMLDTLILSIAKDELVDENELLKHIVDSVEEKLKAVVCKDVTAVSKDFTFQQSEQYD
ncbi:hypothetical protein [Clostridium folliculivorans]|uniref:Uncharacterized protein n=1 Tax=Clostridium folliculivorans TaxID=2886038 RepID=A0A9W5Y0T1_9CLOT|nr:hypothetical protein [Clostridium folliculivorans]GKU24538.1 hypothetical protein CFOLD11_13640 [Clostridium folliculivorans]GKU30636.1 hypothetical protein CFB3_27430 [Clostridium folliculivorans]